MQSLKEKATIGTIWSALDSFAGYGVTFIVGIVLARLLSPDEYGLIGICLIFNTVLSGIVDCGLGNALVRKTNVTNDDYNTMFYTNMVISLVLYALLFFSAPYISLFFNRSELIWLVRITGLVIVANAFALVQGTIITKALDFKLKTKASIISGFISGIVGIIMAISGCGVWSLVFQNVTKAIVNSICLWLFNGWRPSIVFNISSLKYMWGFGWKILVSGLLDRLWQQINQIVVGKFYSSATLGQYTKSHEYANIFSQNITTVVQRVSFPTLSQIQNDSNRLVNVYRQFIKLSMFITTIIMVNLAAISEPFIYCLIGPQWHQAAEYLPLICLIMSLYPMHALNLNLLQVLGRSDIFLRVEVYKKIIGILPLIIGIYMNIMWMLIASLVVSIISFYINSYYVGKLLGYSPLSQLKDVLPFYLLSLASALIIYPLKFLPLSYWLILPIQVVLGFIIIIYVCEKKSNSEYVELKRIFLKTFRRK